MVLATDLDAPSLGAVLKTALDAVVVMRMDGTVAGWNDVATRTFGWSFAEAHGKRMSEMVIPPRYRDAHERGLAHYLATGEGPVLDTHIEIEAMHRDGHELPVELSITRTEQFGEPVFLGFLRDISDRRDAERRQALMIGELNHRVKNLLGVISGIAHQTVRASNDLAQFAPAFLGRLSSLGRAHEILTAATWEHASLSALIDALLDPHRDAQGRITTVGDDMMLSPRQFLSVSMVLHELITNAVKYGALATPDGRIALTWNHADGRALLRWSEYGVTDVVPPAREGFGSKMIALSVRHELRGDSRTDWRNDGMDFALSFDTD